MAEITAALVKTLRETSGAGMMDCKKALSECGGDLEAATDWLRTKGLAAASKKAGRVAAEGLVGVVAEGKSGVMVEINSETDFVSRNPEFQDFVASVARVAAGVAVEQGVSPAGDVAVLAAQPFPGLGKSVEERLTEMVATIGENMTLRRAAALSVSQGLVASYVHAASAPGLGRIGVLVALESEAPAEVLEPLGRHLAMHVAAAAPQSVDVESLDPAAVARERAVLSEQARDSGKPEDIIAKMVEGRLRKFYEDVVLNEQIYVVDGESRVGKVIEAAAKAAGTPIAIAGFARFALGEGIERENKDFAAEVAAQLGS